jgi:thiol-disulfide isomerase/thioredoxin
MIDRRTATLTGLSTLLAAAVGVAPARALDVKPYDAAAADKAIKAGRAVVLHVHAPWCLQCRAQASILAALNDPAYAKLEIFRVDYDGQKSVVEALKVPRSTLIAYKGGKETARMSWGTSSDDVLPVLKAAL